MIGSERPKTAEFQFIFVRASTSDKTSVWPTRTAVEEVMATGHVGAEYVEYVLPHKKGLSPTHTPLRLGNEGARRHPPGRAGPRTP